MRSPVGLMWLLLALAGAPAARAQGSAEAPGKGAASASDEAPGARATSESADAQALRRLSREVRALSARQDDDDRRRDEVQQQLAIAEEAATSLSLQLEAQRMLAIYGFFDLSFQKWWVPQRVLAGDLLDQEPSFIFGNLNLYFDFKPLPDWRMLAEVRFLLNPVGDTRAYEIPRLGERYRKVEVTTNDAGSFGESFDYGAIEIERAWLSWNRLEWLQLTAGLFLTPYGIWNIDHGSPTRLLATSPPVYVLQLFPERQLGLKLHGSTFLRDVRFEYALTLSNGRGDASNLKDPDADKALGGRLVAGGRGDWNWQAGVSWYWGDYSEIKRVFVPPRDVVKETTVRYREAAVGADLSLEVGPFGLQGEVLANWRKYDDDHRPAWVPRGSESFIPADQDVLAQAFPGQFRPDLASWAAIAILSYELPLRRLRLRPFVSATWLDIDDTIPFDNLIDLTYGLNWRVSGAVVVKVAQEWVHWPNKRGEPILLFGSDDVHRFSTQIAVAF
ncbi:MAG: hypothetical protein IPL40_05615 [Proteobacteria bacterium]|nr:hypothetical protein [Pseudomonadota bacterium]